MARQSDSQLSSDANAIAAQPDEWRAAADGVSQDTDGPHGGGRDGHRQPRDLGQRWQILDAAATVVSGSTGDLPVTAGAPPGAPRAPKPGAGGGSTRPGPPHERTLPPPRRGPGPVRT